MANSKYKLVKDDLFKQFTEETIISKQRGLENNKLAQMPLGTLFGFYEASYYLKVRQESGKKVLEFHLVSDKPFSKDEISILQARILVILNTKFDEFEIYQEPENKVDSKDWIKKRKFFETNLGEDSEDPVYRVIGKVKSFPTDVKIHNYRLFNNENNVKEDKKEALKKEFNLEDDKPKVVTKEDEIKNTLKEKFNKILQQAVQSKNYADFTISDISLDKTEFGYNIVAYIDSKDNRVAEFFKDKGMTTQLAKDSHVNNLNSFEVVDIKPLNDDIENEDTEENQI